MLCPFPKRVPGASCQTWMVSGGDRCCEDRDVRESGRHGLGEALRRGDLNGEWGPGAGESVPECSRMFHVPPDIRASLVCRKNEKASEAGRWGEGCGRGWVDRMVPTVGSAVRAEPQRVP